MSQTAAGGDTWSDRDHRQRGGTAGDGGDQPAAVLLFIPAIIGVALLLGRAAGIVATLLAAIITGYAFVSPFGAFALTGAQIVAILIVVMLSLAILLLCEEERFSIAWREVEPRRLQAYVNRFGRRRRPVPFCVTRGWRADREAAGTAGV